MTQSALPPRFWDRVIRLKGPNPCWLFRTPAMDYGSFTIGGQAYPAHVLTYTDAYGPIPEGLEIDHKCRVHACVRPTHLDAVTHAENAQRGHEARRRPGFRTRELRIEKRVAAYRTGDAWAA